MVLIGTKGVYWNHVTLNMVENFPFQKYFEIQTCETSNNQNLFGQNMTVEPICFLKDSMRGVVNW